LESKSTWPERTLNSLQSVGIASQSAMTNHMPIVVALAKEGCNPGWIGTLGLTI
jgi:hypothetical protein